MGVGRSLLLAAVSARHPNLQVSYIRSDCLPCVPPAGLASQLLTLNLHVDWLLFDSTTNDGQVHVPHFRKVGQPGCGLRSLLQQALPQLTVLTSLEVEQVADAFVLTYAPPQLQELVVVGVGDPNKK